MSVAQASSTQTALAELRDLVVEETRLLTEEEAVAPYLEQGADPAMVAAVVLPRTAAEVEGVLEAAGRYRLAVYTPQPWGLHPPRLGVVLDQRMMDRIIDIDGHDLFAVVEPGVTWEALVPELEKRGLRVALPACALSPYVLEHAMRRGAVTSACRFGNRQVSNFHAYLADGRLYRSGSHALPTAKVNWREDGGPNLSRLFLGSHNAMGIPVRGYIYLYPPTEARGLCVKEFPSLGGALEWLRRAARQEVGTELLAMDARGFEVLAGQGAARGGSSWTAAVCLDGPADLVEHWGKRLDRMAREGGGKQASAGKARSLREALDRPWYGGPLTLSFYTTLARVEEFDAVVTKALGRKGKLARLVVPVRHGASAFLRYDLEAEEKAGRGWVLDLLPRLADRGAFFDSPTGSLAAHIFSKQPAYLELLKQVKRVMDPGGMLNPGVLGEVA
jgi:FAD/FMN-containing dehydrogenase